MLQLGKAFYYNEVLICNTEPFLSGFYDKSILLLQGKEQCTAEGPRQATSAAIYAAWTLTLL